MSELRNLHYLKAFGYDFFDKKPLSFFNKNLAFSNDKFNENLNFTQKTQAFFKLKEQISNCELCSLSKKRRKASFNRNLKRDLKQDLSSCCLMIIKEFISKKEHENGDFFKDAQGLELKNLLLNELNLNENELYLSSIYKCFNDEKPDAAALHQCLPYVFEEIKLLKPFLILILGEGAFKTLKFEGFKERRGQFFEFLGALTMASFDLDFLSKNPSHKQDFIKDLQKFAPHLQKIKLN